MEQNKVLDTIINLIQGIKSNQNLSSNFNNELLQLDQCGYLLSQVLRHYKLKPSQSFVSEKAFELWSKITTENIFNYTYRDKVTKNIHGEIFVDKYKGGEKYPHQTNCLLSYGDTFTFNDVFIDEHVVPVNVIIKELKKLPTLDYISVKNVLDKLCICKLLKEEDRKIKNKNDRSTDYKEVFYTDYLQADIMVKDFTYDIFPIETFSEEPRYISIDPIIIKNTTKKVKKHSYQEEFTFINTHKSYNRKNGFPAINSNGDEIGIVFMGDDSRTPSYMCCELCIYDDFYNKYGKWHRITSHGNRIKWNDLCATLETNKSIKIFID